MTDRVDTCASCRFFKGSVRATTPGDLALYGECRRHAPVVMDRGYNHPVHGMQHETTTAFPELLSTEWCGDFEAKRAA